MNELLPAKGLTRRHFLRHLLAFIGGLVGMAARAWVSPTRAEKERQIPPGEIANLTQDEALVKEGRWAQAGADFAAGQLTDLVASEAGLTLAPGASEGSYLSPEKLADFPFNALGALWRVDKPQGTSLALEIRARRQGQEWSAWAPMVEVDQLRGLDAPAVQPVMLAGTFIQYRVTLSTSDPSRRPQLRQMTIIYLDSTSGPNLAQARASAIAGPATNAVPRPPIIPRAGWGANESYRYYQGREVWPPQYVFPTKIVAHHTVTRNDDDNPVATVRAIYYYHAVTLGWGDVGYNYLVDRFGNIYEGRYGGERVVGGHIQRYNPGSIGIGALGTYLEENPPPPLESGLISLYAWAAFRYGIEPRGSSFFVDRELPNLMGHRDALNTSCPGDRLYARLSDHRAAAWARLPEYGEAWVEQVTPQRLGIGQTVTVAVKLRNSGRLTWRAGGSTPFRLGYKWYDRNGRQVVQDPSEDHRTALPRDIGPGEEVALSARLTAPRQAGNYELKWDMVHERVTWFEWQGNTPLAVRIAVGMDEYRAGWGGHNTPTSMRPGETRSVRVEVENRGSRTWTTGGRNAFRLGYRWYDQGGRQVVQDPAEDHRGTLPREVAPGERVAVDTRLTSPRQPGTYTLKWDMVHEGVTWFATRGSPTLDVVIQVRRGETYEIFLPFVGKNAQLP